jgi:hypothetical protein
VTDKVKAAIKACVLPGIAIVTAPVSEEKRPAGEKKKGPVNGLHKKRNQKEWIMMRVSSWQQVVRQPDVFVDASPNWRNR